jgi:hypothetical protein
MEDMTLRTERIELRAVRDEDVDRRGGDGHRNVCLDPPWPGELILDVVQDDIVYVEVLYRPTLCCGPMGNASLRGPQYGVDLRHFVLWLRTSHNPARDRRRADAPVPGSVNVRTGKAYLGAGYAPATINHRICIVTAQHPGAGSLPARSRSPRSRRRVRRRTPRGQPKLVSRAPLAA